MRSDLARAPVNLQPPQRTGFDDFKKTSSGSYTGVARQPSAGRKPPLGKIVLPEFPRRDGGSGYRQGSITGGSNYGSPAVTAYGGDHTRPVVGSGTSYGSVAGVGRSTSVPRPTSCSDGATQIASGVGSSNHVSTGSVATAAITSVMHASPRGAGQRPPVASPGSILDTLTTPSVLSVGGTRASLAQRMNNSSIMDYSMLSGGASISTVRIKRHEGSVSGDAASAPGAPPGASVPHYSNLNPAADQLRAIYMSGPALSTSGAGSVAGMAGSGGGVSAVTGSGRRGSTERSAVDRIVSRASSFSSQNGSSYGIGQGGPPSPVDGSGLSSSAAALGAVTAAPPPLAASPSFSSYHSMTEQPSRLAPAGAVLASQYAHQYGSQSSTVYIPNFSQHPPPAGGLYGSASGGGGAHYVQQSRPTSLSVSSGSTLPPVVPSPSASNSPSVPPAPTHLGTSPASSAVSAQLYHQNGVDYAPRSLQKSASASRSVLNSATGTGGGSVTANGVAGRLRAMSLNPADDDNSRPDGGSNSSLRRVQLQDEQPRRSGNGAALPSATGAQYLGSVPAVGTPKPAPSAPPSADYLLPTQSRIQQPQLAQQHHHHTQQHQSQLHPHANAHPHASMGVGVGVAGFSGPTLDAGGSSYTSTASSNGSSGSSSSAAGGSSGGGVSSSSKSSVTVAGTGVSSASTSRTTSSISQRSVADALAAHAQTHASQGFASTSPAAKRPVASTATAKQPRAGQQTAAIAGVRDGCARSSSESVGGTLSRAQSGAAVGGAPQSHDPGEGGPVCGPLPDLPLLVAPRDMSPGRGCVGLQNLGNTCFMNSILQSLNAVPELVQQFLNPSDRHWSSKAVVAPAYSGLVRDMITGAHGTCVNPSAFLRKVAKRDGRWGDGRQQDSQEFLNSLLEALQAECNRISTKPVYRELQGKGSEEAQAVEAYDYARSWNDSIVDDIFGGLTQSTIQCHACKRLSHTFEPFLGLAVPIPSSAAGGGAADPDGGPVSVADCLRAFVECEELEGDDSYKCEACKRRQPHSKRMQIFRPPRVLVLTLKRFAQRPAAPGFLSRFRSPAKNNTPVRLEPEPLDLTPYCNPLGLHGLCVHGHGSVPPLYQLAAVSHHSGSLEGGHYTAQARNCLDGQWYNFNDSCVRREAGRPNGSSSSAYVLFYRLANLPSPLPSNSNL